MTDRDQEALESGRAAAVQLADELRGRRGSIASVVPWGDFTRCVDKGIRHALTLARRGSEVSWRPIETAPKDGTHILAWFHDDDPMRHHLGEYQSGCSIAAWVDHNGGGWVRNRLGEPTHWMPLPAPPEGEEGGEHG